MSWSEIIAALVPVLVGGGIWWCGYAFGRGVERRSALRRALCDPVDLDRAAKAFVEACGWPLDRHQPGGQGRAPDTGKAWVKYKRAGRKS